MIEAGQPYPLGARSDRDGVNFALYSAHAERVVLCLFDASGKEMRQLELPGSSDHVWHGFVPGLKPGQQYGYRVHGRYEPQAGYRFNAAKLLLDPYARQLVGAHQWSPAVYGYDVAHAGDYARINHEDSAKCVLRAVVTGPLVSLQSAPQVPWSETIFYEANVRGFTMQHPAVSETDRGTFRGMRNGEVLAYLKALGITSIELMPVQAFIDEAFLEARGLRNYWGYNTLNFFAPEPRYLGGGAPCEFREMVDSIHGVGIEVILDVVYNHTAEGDHRGPTLSLRGIDNHTYYRLQSDDPGRYVNDTGCGNTLNFDHPQTRQLVIDSLCFWAGEMGVDGFRFDLAPVNGRSGGAFAPEAPFFAELQDVPLLSAKKLIAEPWDVGPGGYQLGNFPANWAEWNDNFRDSVRRFWRGDDGILPRFARRIHGSSDLFDDGVRQPWASVNFITSHDGFTVNDLVTYEQKHNLANGEDNQDGHNHNFACNYGVEGPTDDEAVNALRRRQRLNMLATVLLSQGTPMLLAGDEFGNSQQGNNNAYAQDNRIGWLDWKDPDSDPDFLRQIRGLINLRRRIALLRPEDFLHGEKNAPNGRRNIEWLGAGGQKMSDTDWQCQQYLTLLLSETESGRLAAGAATAVAISVNAATHSMNVHLPQISDRGKWHTEFYSGVGSLTTDENGSMTIEGQATACLVWLVNG